MHLRGMLTLTNSGSGPSFWEVVQHVLLSSSSISGNECCLVLVYGMGLVEATAAQRELNTSERRGIHRQYLLLLGDFVKREAIPTGSYDFALDQACLSVSS